MGASSGMVVTQTKKSSKNGQSSARPRLKREDHCLPIALDNLFSPWKVLVGPNDWKNHSKGIEGAERYRVHNLPTTYFGPGVYELGLHLDCRTHTGGVRGKDASRLLKKGTIIVVYVGQAESIRTRLQHYGRCGSHLEGGTELLKGMNSQLAEITAVPRDLDRIADSSRTPEEDSCRSPRLFTQAFSEGYSIAFRWTAAGSKGDATSIETGLLQFFDYPWNRGSNGKRRPCDAFGKLQRPSESRVDSSKARICFKPSKWAIRLPKLGTSGVQNLRGKRTVATFFKERLQKLDILPKRLSDPIQVGGLYLDLLSLPWKTQLNEGKSSSSSWQARISLYRYGSVKKSDICGIIGADGKTCKATPSQGRKRCEAHKGMRIFIPRTKMASSPMAKKHLVSVHTCNYDDETMNPMAKKHLVSVHTCTYDDETVNGVDDGVSQSVLVCGYVLNDGSKCAVSPEKGRKRCLSHKGRRIKAQ